MSWNELNDQDQTDLLNWYNVRAEDVDYEDKRRLAKLFESGRFEAWDCPECGERVYRGEPDNWGHFQGVLQVNYTSFPGNSDKYQPAYLERLCDSDRMGHA